MGQRPAGELHTQDYRGIRCKGKSAYTREELNFFVDAATCKITYCDSFTISREQLEMGELEALVSKHVLPFADEHTIGGVYIEVASEIVVGVEGTDSLLDLLDAGFRGVNLTCYQQVVVLMLDDKSLFILSVPKGYLVYEPRDEKQMPCLYAGTEGSINIRWNIPSIGESYRPFLATASRHLHNATILNCQNDVMIIPHYFNSEDDYDYIPDNLRRYDIEILPCREESFTGELFVENGFDCDDRYDTKTSKLCLLDHSKCDITVGFRPYKRACFIELEDSFDCGTLFGGSHGAYHTFVLQGSSIALFVQLDNELEFTRSVWSIPFIPHESDWGGHRWDYPLDELPEVFRRFIKFSDYAERVRRANELNYSLPEEVMVQVNPNCLILNTTLYHGLK